MHALRRLYTVSIIDDMWNIVFFAYLPNFFQPVKQWCFQILLS